MIIKNNDSLATQIYFDLKTKIEEFEYKPGDQISESSLSTIYNVSRTPIKHSLARLENEELIDVKPQRGTYVSKIDTNHVSEFFMIRMLLELSILDEVIRNLNEELISTLNNNINAQKNLVSELKENSNIDAGRIFWKLDNAFHKTIFSFVNKAYIWDFIMSQSSQFNRYRLLTVSKDEHYLNAKITEHENIVKYLTGDLKVDPTTLYNAHLFDTLTETIESLKIQYPNYIK